MITKKSKTLLEQLNRHKEYGSALSELLDKVAQLLPNDGNRETSELRRALPALQQSADHIIQQASAPITIGLMGEFSCGKTLLLGSLFGFADALPIDPSPTTGNITAIHLVQQSSFKTTRVGKFIVRYVSKAQVRACLEHMLKELRQRAIAAKLPASQIAALDSLSPDAIDPQAILEWCQQVWQNRSAKLRYLLYELVIFMQSYAAYGQHLCGRSYAIDPEIAASGLKLANPVRDILECSFENLPAAPKLWSDWAVPSVQDLQSSFALIHRVDVTVEVSQEIWDLSMLRGTNEFVLLDCPGLGSDSSSVRDAFLSLQELKQVQTILLVLDSRRPGGGVAAEIRSMLEQIKDTDRDLKERILVAVSRFDELPLGEAEKHKLEQFAQTEDSETPFETLLNEEALYAEIGSLDRMMLSANNLTTEKKNIVLVSPLYGLSKLAERSSQIQVASDTFLPELDKPRQPQAVQIRETWRTVSEALPSSSLLHKQLSEYVGDGGISHLRSLLRDHITQHGMKLLLNDTQAKTNECSQQIQAQLKPLLPKLTANLPVIEHPDFQTLRDAIDHLVSVYREFRSEIEAQPMFKTADGTLVSEAVKQELTNRIFDWQEWNLLFDKTREGLISATPKQRSRLGYRPEERDLIPTQSHDFFELFRHTLIEMQLFAHQQTEHAIAALFAQLAQKLASAQTQLSTISAFQTEQQYESVEQSIFEKFGAKKANLFTSLHYSISPKRWQSEVLENRQLTQIQSLQIKDAFPLARQDDGHEKSQIFHWNPEKKSLPPRARPFNYQVTVLRVRDEMITSANLHLTQEVSRLVEAVKVAFFESMENFTNDLPELLKVYNESLLRYIAAAETPDQSAIPLWLELLQQIVSLQCPE